ncbi:MAG: hypothetical protein IMF01_04990, partial [Proteobacteria bacterium]|nr:hypothetical protein [Pseudomonadota bacterium]
PPSIMPALVEWWLITCKTDKDYRAAEIFQIESVKVEDPDDDFWSMSRVFIDNKEPAQSMIISASTKAGTIWYYAEDVNGDPCVNPVTMDVAQAELNSPNILIYRCLPRLMIKQAEEEGWASLLGKRIGSGIPPS